MTDIILILYGDRKDLDTCIKSIETNCEDYTLHIMDNNQANKGFTKACNEGMAAGTGEWIWLLNQDAIVLPGAQKGLINMFSYHPKVGIVGSMQRDPTDPDIIRHGGTLRAFPGGVHDGGRVSMGHCSIPKKQTWVNYASVAFRRKMVQEIGPMDDSMFLLYSDSDYCYYARSKGWEVWYAPESQVLHRLNASKTISEWHEKDMRAFMKKWGIIQTDKGFVYSDGFSKLDMFP